MITFPPEFIATQYPGYYWNTITKSLFSIKSGVLKELAKTRPNRFNRFFSGYVVSHKGIRRGLKLEYLQNLQPKDSVVQMEGYGYTVRRSKNEN